MAHTYEELKDMNVMHLRTIAEELGDAAPNGYKTLNKEHLLPALCKALGIEMHAHHEVVGVDKTAIKTRIRALKKERDAALASGNSGQARQFMRRIHHLKREIRKATV